MKMIRGNDSLRFGSARFLLAGRRSIYAWKPSGQSLVEFALVIPILILLIMGAFDFGRVFYIKLSLKSIAREAAYHLSYYPADVTGCSIVGGQTICQPNATTSQAIATEANNLGINLAGATVQVIGTRAQTTPVEVRITQTVNLYIFNFFSGPINLTSSVRMLVQ